MIGNFGTSRVIEPKYTTPVSAWKLDSTMECGDDEALIKVRLISFEREAIDQIFSSSDYNEDRVKMRIMKIVSERGKFHNPYTDSSGIFAGTIVKAGKDFDLKKRGLKVGDDVVCLSPLAGLCLSLNAIDNINYYYGQAEVDGYAICFNSTQIKPIDSRFPLHTLIRAVDEGGNFICLGEEIKKRNFKKVALIGCTMTHTILYSSLLRKVSPKGLHITLIADSATLGAHIKIEDLKAVYGDLIDDIYIVDVDNSLEAAAFIMEEEREKGEFAYFDGVVNLEHLAGAANLSTFLVKDGGFIGYITLNNQYNIGLLLADSMGKEIISYTSDGYHGDAYDYGIELLSGCGAYLEKLDEFYKTLNHKRIEMPAKAKTIDMAAQTIDGFVYMSPKTAAMIDEVLNIAKYDCNVIIQGETGVGKERVFDLIYSNSSRNDKPCVRINCATIQENLAESEFFGYEKGSFTGALSGGKQGYFEMANNGTLFLDEIGTLSLDMQAKLLRVLQNSTFYKVGGTKPIHVNVRIVAANNIPLKKLVAEGKFREDLFYRLDICEIQVPPLRNRPEDIRCLSEAFLSRYSEKYGMKKTFLPEAFEELEKYHWPGNVRELENAVHRLYISTRSEEIDSISVNLLLNDNVYEESIIDIRKEFSRDDSMDFEKIMEEQEKKLIAYALKKEGTTRKAAAFLKMPQATLARKKTKYGL